MSLAAQANVGRSGSIEERTILWMVAALVAALSLLPIMRLALEALASGAVAEAWRRPAAWRALLHSLETSVGATLIALVAGGIVALVVTLTDIRARTPFVFLFVMPLIIAPQVMALAWLQVSGPSSPLLKALGLAPPLGSRNPLYSAGGITLLLAIEYAPLVFLTLGRVCVRFRAI